MSIIAASLGFPRIGVGRELKKSLENYWTKKISCADLEDTARKLRAKHWLLAKEAGVDHIPSNDFSLYDHMLDMAVTLGVIPERYRQIKDATQRYFAMARGLQDLELGVDIPALEMTKWFDTNYHYIVPELHSDQRFSLDASKIFAEISEARALGIEVRPVIPGPVTFLHLSKMAPQKPADKRPIDLLERILPVYLELLAALADRGVAWVQIDEPCLVLELDEATRKAYKRALSSFDAAAKRPRLMFTSYFGALGANLQLIKQTPIDGLHIDLVRSPEQLTSVLEQLSSKTLLSLGLVDGRNIWRTDLDRALLMAQKAARALGEERIAIATSCSLLHTPVDLEIEKELDPDLKSWLSFATQKLAEIRAVARAVSDENSQEFFFAQSRAALANRARSSKIHDPEVRRKMLAVTPAMLARKPFAERSIEQRRRFDLPAFPTTTIGSFPQTADIRKARAAWRAGTLSEEAYDVFLKEATRHCIEKQNDIGLDVLVHGEFERTDMVEYFGEKLKGFAFTKNAWVQSYGSRCVKPPVLFGDVARPLSMTVTWSQYAQSLTEKPVKGMLTGPVTILQWSFVRDDQPRRDTCMQIALALREEVLDLEKAGIAMIQVDEPAIREGLPLRKSEWSDYLKWAVDAFLLATRGIRDETQIHTHMCYSEFGDILDSIAAMDADVLSIETSRSKMEILADFGRFHYPNAIGPGVYDIHSPRVPSQGEMEELLVRASEVLPADQLWVNPDCGLKTRAWLEVEGALSCMVRAAQKMRARAAVSADPKNLPISQNFKANATLSPC